MRIVIAGAGGHGAVVADILREEAVGFVDDRAELHGTTVLGLPVFGPIASLPEVSHDTVVVAIGDNGTRREVMERLVAAGERLATAIHPFTSIAPSATIGEGSMICAGAIILPRAVIGRGVIINTKGSVDHDCVVGAFAHLAVGATLGGNVRVGEESLVAIGASIIPGRSVGARTVVGAGAVVVRDVPDDVTVLGVPARIASRRG